MDQETKRTLENNHPERADLATKLFNQAKEEGYPMPDEVLAALCRLEAKRLLRG